MIHAGRYHYIITLQRMGQDGHMRYSTQNGGISMERHDGEQGVFLRIWGTACEEATKRANELGVRGAWTGDNTSVLFYRLLED